MKLQTLQALIAVENLGSIRAAATHLHVSQSSLTAAIQALEEELGAPLLARSQQGVSLTNFGQAFMRHARVIVAESQRAQEEIAQMRGRWEGSVRFSTSPAVALDVLPRALRFFTQKYPDVRIECRDGLYPGVSPALRDGSLDFAISPVHRREIDSALVAEPLFVSDIVVVSDRSHPLSRAKSLSELVDCGWVMSSASRGPGAVIEEAFADCGLPPPRVGMVCESFLGLPGILAGSSWMATMPRVLFEKNPYAASLCIVDVSERIPTPTVSVLRRQDLPLTPAAQHLVRWIQHCAVRSD
ncbi:LysR substrate-binding domain-containing protein [Variovorax sp. J31P179]|uniref:LysR substrate-binding domain-containing protein n=1 Tax=Variovorax sp. J31P179 TaxID=3053508 RepID=UPI00257797E2|nr:LysR substrate-binding domain-containing protein [Variovorax sp. J31P179]MDM0085376.1 LysR substrate-binding domain-containing protein [Variovorax sp. J31P179]